MRQVGYLQGSYQDARSAKHKIQQNIKILKHVGVLYDTDITVNIFYIGWPKQ